MAPFLQTALAKNSKANGQGARSMAQWQSTRLACKALGLISNTATLTPKQTPTLSPECPPPTSFKGQAAFQTWNQLLRPPYPGLPRSKRTTDWASWGSAVVCLASASTRRPGPPPKN